MDCKPEERGAPISCRLKGPGKPQAERTGRSDVMARNLHWRFKTLRMRALPLNSTSGPSQGQGMVTEEVSAVSPLQGPSCKADLSPGCKQTGCSTAAKEHRMDGVALSVDIREELLVSLFILLRLCCSPIAGRPVCVMSA